MHLQSLCKGLMGYDVNMKSEQACGRRSMQFVGGDGGGGGGGGD